MLTSITARVNASHRARSIATILCFGGCALACDGLPAPVTGDSAVRVVIADGSTFRLRSLNGQSLPAPVFAVAGGRRADLIAAALVFRGSDLRGAHSAGKVDASSTVRTVEASGQATTDSTTSAGRFTQEGDTVRVRFADGGGADYVTQPGRGALRTIASYCGQTREACANVLQAWVYERVD